MRIGLAKKITSRYGPREFTGISRVNEECNMFFATITPKKTKTLH